MTAAELLQALAASLATTYPTTIADMASRHGVVTAAVVPDRVQYEDVACDPTPILLTATVVVQSAVAGEQGTIDLIGHTDTVAGLIRAAGFTPTEWNPAEIEDQPAIEFTCTANGNG